MSLNLNAQNAGVPQELTKTAANERVPPARLERSEEGIEQNVPRLIAGMTDPRHVVDVLERDGAAGADNPHEFGYEPFGFGKVDEDEALVRKVESFIAETLAEAIRLYESHVGQAASRNFALRHLSKGTLAFEPDYKSAAPDALRQEVEDSD